MGNPQGRSWTLLAILVCAASPTVSASTFTVDFNPASPANTNGWDFGTTTTNETKSGTQPGGRKFDPAKGATIAIESPMFSADVRSVALTAWGNNINNGNASVVDVWGRADADEPYASVFSRTGLANTVAANAPLDKFSVPDGMSVRQLKIGYTKDMGSWVLATVAITDDDVSLSPPTDLCSAEKETDETGAAFEVSWTLPPGITTSEYQVFEISTSGGVDESQPVWRETFAAVPSRTTARQVTAALMSDWGLSEWGFETVYQKFEGALLVGGEDDKAGALVTPPFWQSVESGHWIAVRAHKHDTKTGGAMDVSHVSGVTTNLVGVLTLPLEPSLLSLQLPALVAGDRILFQPRAANGVKNHKTIIDEVALCSDFVPETVKTNEFIDVTGTDETSLTIPKTSRERTSLLFRVRSVSGEKRSEWTETVRLAATAASEEADNGAGDEAAGLSAPGNVRAGLLPDGRIRLGWTTPDGATNVTLRVWTLASEGGLAAATADDIPWRETFATAPATNSNILIDSDKELADYTGRGDAGWNLPAFSRVYLSTSAAALRIGTTDNPGAIASKPLAVSGDGLSLVVTAKRGSGEKNSGVILRPALLSDAATTNTLGQTTLSAEFAEYAFAISSPLTGSESLLLESVIDTPKDGRIIIDDIALVRGYSPVSTTTNEVTTVDLGASEEYDLAADDAEAVRYATLYAQDATGATSEWTTPLALDPNALGEWKPLYLTPDCHGEVDASLDLAALPAATDASLDVSGSPFRFLLDGDEWLTVSRNKDVTKSFSAGVYVCTNVFERDWLVLTPYSAEKKSDVKTAEMRVAIETGEFALRKVAVSGEFAQLGASNNDERALRFQWRSIARNGATTGWQDFGEYATAYTAADTPGDLSGTVKGIAAETTLQAPSGARVEARLLIQRLKDQKEAPLGFRDFRLRAESADRAFLVILR